MTAAERAARSRREQGLPETIANPDALSAAAAVLAPRQPVGTTETEND